MVTVESVPAVHVVVVAVVVVEEQPRQAVA